MREREKESGKGGELVSEISVEARSRRQKVVVPISLFLTALSDELWLSSLYLPPPNSPPDCPSWYSGKGTVDTDYAGGKMSRLKRNARISGRATSYTLFCRIKLKPSPHDASKAVITASHCNNVQWKSGRQHAKPPSFPLSLPVPVAIWTGSHNNNTPCVVYEAATRGQQNDDGAAFIKVDQ